MRQRRRCQAATPGGVRDTQQDALAHLVSFCSAMTGSHVSARYPLFDRGLLAWFKEQHANQLGVLTSAQPPERGGVLIQARQPRGDARSQCAPSHSGTFTWTQGRQARTCSQVTSWTGGTSPREGVRLTSSSQSTLMEEIMPFPVSTEIRL